MTIFHITVSLTFFITISCRKTKSKNVFLIFSLFVCLSLTVFLGTPTSFSLSFRFTHLSHPLNVSHYSIPPHLFHLSYLFRCTPVSPMSLNLSTCLTSFLLDTHGLLSYLLFITSSPPLPIQVVFACLTAHNHFLTCLTTHTLCLFVSCLSPVLCLISSVRLIQCRCTAQ